LIATEDAPDEESSLAVDVNQDGDASPLDILQLIDFLGRRDRESERLADAEP